MFLDHPHGAIKLENLLNTYKYLHIYNIYGYLRIYLRSPAAILVVMAVDEVESFQLAEHILVYLSHTGHIGDKVETHVTRGITLTPTRVCRSSSSWPTRRTRCAAGRSSPPPASRWLSSTGSSTLKHPLVRATDYRYYRSILDNNGSHAGINHNIDELLVGVYTQIRLRQKYSYKKPVSIDKVLKV